MPDVQKDRPLAKLRRAEERSRKQKRRRGLVFKGGKGLRIVLAYTFLLGIGLVLVWWWAFWEGGLFTTIGLIVGALMLALGVGWIVNRDGVMNVINIVTLGGLSRITKRLLKMTPLHRASSRGDTEAVIALIDQGADISARDAAGGTPLHWCLMRGHEGIADILLSAAESLATQAHPKSSRYVSLLADIVDVADMKGYTPLHYACALGLVPTVERLLADCFANPNGVSAKPDTPSPLLLAIANGHTEVVRVLVRHHAHVGHRDIQAAEGMGDQKMVNLLRRHKAS